MYLKLGDRILNTANMTDAEIKKVNGELIVRVWFVGREVRLDGDAAEAFLAAIPTYTSVPEG